MIDKRFHPIGKVANCKRKPHEIATKNGLALTPAEMHQMMIKGIPITPQNGSQAQFVGEENPSWDIPLDRARGSDINEMWQAKQSINRKANEGLKRDINLYGHQTA